MAKTPSGALVVVAAKDGDGFYWEAKWRSGGKQKKRRLGKAWMVPKGSRGARQNGKTVGTYRERKGHVLEGLLSVDDAVVEMRRVIADDIAAEGERQRKKNAVLFSRAAREWFIERKAVAGWKATTERNYRALLAEPGQTPKRRGHKPRARLLTTFGKVEVQKITTADVRAFLRTLDADPDLSPRSVNAHRLALSMILDFAVRQGWRPDNPVAGTSKRREADAKELIVYSPEQVFAIADEMGDYEAMRAMIVVAAFSGLRMGELLELRWRDADFAGRSIRVQRAYTDGVGVVTPKSRRGRSLPLADQAAQALAKLGQRGFLVRPGDLIFPAKKSGLRTSVHFNQSTVRAMYVAARDRARKKDRDIAALTFHELRHTFGSLCAVASVPMPTLQRWMGHGSLKTTMRYVHFIPQRDDADRLSAAFRAGTTAELAEPEIKAESV